MEDVNPEEEIKDMEIVEQPEWVRTMDDNIKNYNLPAERFLKNVVYKNRVDGHIYIVTIRGDLQVNKNKLEKLLNLVGLLDDATDEDIISIGSKPGWVHSWGYGDHKVTFVADNSLKTVKNFVGGQKVEKTDSVNVNYGRDFKHEIEGDVALAQSGFTSPDGKSKLIEKKGIEVGNIFQLGQHYSKKMRDAVFVDSDGKSKEFFMGCYGIGLGRTMATIVEVSHDNKGIIWPDAVAPYQVHLLGLNLEDSEIRNKAEQAYKYLTEKGVEVLYDDREGINPGSKFADSDLIGIPWRVVVSKRTGDGVEIKKRGEEKSEIIELAEFQV
ncbi:MAG TPA: YbaK/EbsC family protein [Candidatus Dojkabacteria bacterium]|nr:YbaK/EbsC family protein [Candidatus Dojkabacteria bacterium]